MHPLHDTDKTAREGIEILLRPLIITGERRRTHEAGKRIHNRFREACPQLVAVVPVVVEVSRPPVVHVSLYMQRIRGRIHIMHIEKPARHSQPAHFPLCLIHPIANLTHKVSPLLELLPARNQPHHCPQRPAPAHRLYLVTGVCASCRFSCPPK